MKKHHASDVVLLIPLGCLFSSQRLVGAYSPSTYYAELNSAVVSNVFPAPYYPQFDK